MKLFDWIRKCFGEKVEIKTNKMNSYVIHSNVKVIRRHYQLTVVEFGYTRDEAIEKVNAEIKRTFSVVSKCIKTNKS